MWPIDLQTLSAWPKLWASPQEHSKTLSETSGLIFTFCASYKSSHSEVWRSHHFNKPGWDMEMKREGAERCKWWTVSMIKMTHSFQKVLLSVMICSYFGTPSLSLLFFAYTSRCKKWVKDRLRGAKWFWVMGSWAMCLFNSPNFFRQWEEGVRSAHCWSDTQRLKEVWHSNLITGNKQLLLLL